jgi:hypothetical protein
MRFPHVILLSACALMWTATLLAQSPNGVINGLVGDPSNRMVVGADVVVANDVTGLKYTTKTNDEGIYVLPNLPPGPYRLQVSKIGFKTTIKPDIVLNVQDALSINFTLAIGASYETVTVEGGASMVNTTDASVSTLVDQTYIKNMPLNGRSFQDLILLTPGSVTQTPQVNPATSIVGLSGEFSVNGQRPESNYYTVDGVSANVGASADGQWTIFAGISGSVAAATALGTTQALVSVDALQEFRVQSSTYSAEYGRNPGGQFSLETKSGTNQWHGTMYDYLRNGALDATDWFNDYFSVKAPNLRQNDFGGTLGGPLIFPNLYVGKDKTFFLVSYEGLRLAAPQAAIASYVPDTCMRGVVSECPSGRQPAASALQPVIQAYPLPSANRLEDGEQGVGQFVGSWSNPGSINSRSLRLDHVVNERLKLFFRFSDTASNVATRKPYTTAPPSLVSTTNYVLRTYTGGVSNILTSHVSNEFRINYSSNEATSRNDINSFGGSSPVNLLQLSGLGPRAGSDVYFFLGPYTFLFGQGQRHSKQSQWNLIDALSFSSGRHQVKVGADFRRLAPYGIQPDLLAEYFFFSESAVESNSPFVNPTSIAPAHPLYRNFSAFVQDEWRMSGRLNLSLGLRWEVNPAPGVTQGLKPYAIQGAAPNAWTLAPQGTPLWHTTWYNFAPRMGMAYRLHDTQYKETVLRVGGGVFFDTGQQSGSGGYNGPGFRANAFQAGGSFPGDPGLYPPIVNPPLPPFGLMYAVYPRLQLPYTLQWNASMEQSLGKSQALSVSFVGSHASRLLQENQVSVPLASTLLIAQNGLTSDYDSLQIQYRRRLTRGLTALASYTWSHCIDYGSQNYLFGFQRGNCDFDVRHNLSAAFSYDLPNVEGSGITKAVLRHWGVDNRFIMRTGFPVTLNGNALVQPSGLTYNAGLNLVSGQDVYLFGANCASVLQGLGDLHFGQGCPGGRAINPLAFSNVDSGLGDAPRNFARGFGAWQMNLAVRRDFPVFDRLSLQFRAEAFNIFNHPNFGTVDSNFGQNTFGQATGTLANSLGILNSLYQAGGPRSMQIALKFVF